MKANYYGLTGACQDSGVRPVIPVTFAAVPDDGDSITITWDETDMEADFLQMQTALGILEIGTVETVGTTALLGTDTTFTDYVPGGLVYVQGETPRVIESITDDTHLIVKEAFTNTDVGLFCVFSDEFAFLVELKPGLGTYINIELTAETSYFYKMRVHKKFKWSNWNSLLAVATTTA